MEKRVAWTAASQHRGVPTATWEGWSNWQCLGMEGLKQTLAAKRR